MTIQTLEPSRKRNGRKYAKQEEFCSISDLARQDLQIFSEYLGYKNAPFHNEWYDLLQPANNKQHFSPFPWHPLALKTYHLEAPRKHAKSECISINYPSWLIGNCSDIHITIVSKTSELAEQTVNAIKTRMEQDERYINVFGELKPQESENKKWTGRQLIVKRPTISKFPTLYATGLHGSLTGGGNDLLLFDDVIDEEDTITPLSMDRASTWVFKVALTTLFPWGAAFVLGTRWHYADLYTQLLDKWPSKVYKAILNEDEIVKGAQPAVLWPKVWSYDKLIQRRDEIGTIFFACQYQNDPSNMVGIALKSEWLRNWTAPPTGLKYAGVDPKGEGEDLFAISTWQHNPQMNKLYLWDVWAENVSQLEGLMKLRQLHETHNYARIYFESNALQKSLLNHPELRGLPTSPTLTDANKERRIISMSSHYQSGRVEINSLINNQRSEFWKEWVQFPRGQHDCALDACEVVTRNLIANVGTFMFGGGVAR